VIRRTKHSEDKQFCLQRDFGTFRKYKVLFPVNDSLADLVRFLMAKERVSEETLEHDDSHAPNVHSMVIGLLSQHFWSNIVRSPHL
jgi:hypothetical protein